MDSTYLITILLGLPIFIYLIRILAYRNRTYWKDRGVPYMKNPLPLFGNTYGLIKRTETMGTFLHRLYNEFEGERFCGCLFNQKPSFLPRDPELVNAILIKDFDHFYDRLPLARNSNLVTNGLFNMSGDTWRNLRYNLTPIFTSNKLKTMFNSIKENSDETVLNLKEKKSYDSKDIFSKFVINVIGDVAFGIKVNAFNDENGLFKAFLDGSNALFSPGRRTLIRQIISSQYPKVADWLRLRIISKDIDDFFGNLVNDMTEQRQKSKNIRNDFLQLMLEKQEKEKIYMKSLKNKSKIIQDQNIEGEEPEDDELLEQLKCLKHTVNDKVSSQYKEIFNEDIIAAQAFTFISAGSETVSSVLSFSFLELSLNLDVQERLYEEIVAVAQESGFNYESIKKMKYLDQVLNEAMRKYPATGVLFRLCTKDYKIPDSNITLEKGTPVFISLNGLHMDPKHFPDPEKFDPDRFSDPNSIPKNVFYPFGGGPRMCIAMRLAILELKIFVATLIMNFTITLSEKTKLPITLDTNSFLPRAAGGIWLKFEKRKNTV